MSRMKLDRRRFEAAHLRYAMLVIMGSYSNIKQIPLHVDISESLKAFSYECFSERFAGTIPSYILDYT